MSAIQRLLRADGPLALTAQEVETLQGHYRLLRQHVGLAADSDPIPQQDGQMLLDLCNNRDATIPQLKSGMLRALTEVIRLRMLLQACDAEHPDGAKVYLLNFDPMARPISITAPTADDEIRVAILIGAYLYVNGAQVPEPEPGKPEHDLAARSRAKALQESFDRGEEAGRNRVLTAMAKRFGAEVANDLAASLQQEEE